MLAGVVDLGSDRVGGRRVQIGGRFRRRGVEWSWLGGLPIGGQARRVRVWGRWVGKERAGQARNLSGRVEGVGMNVFDGCGWGRSAVCGCG